MASYFRQVPDFEYVSRNYNEQNISDYVPVKNLFKRGKLREDIFGNLAFFEKYSIVGDERPDNVAYKFYSDETLDWIVLLANNILNIQSEWPMTQITFDSVMIEKYGSYENLYSGIHHYDTVEINDSLGTRILPGGLRKSNNEDFNFDPERKRKILSISCPENDGDLFDGQTALVTLTSPIENLESGNEIIISEVQKPEYNGSFKVKNVYTQENTTQFTYELNNLPRNPQEILTNNGILNTFILSSYLRFYDSGVEKDIQISPTDYLIPVTNYEYEINIENEKRNIYILKPSYLNIVFDDMSSFMPYKQGSEQYVSRTLKRGDNIRLSE